MDLYRCLATLAIVLFAGCTAEADRTMAAPDTPTRAETAEATAVKSVTAATEKRPSVGDVSTRVFGSVENFALMQSAADVKACRLRPKQTPAEENESATPGDYLDGFEDGPFVAVSPTQAARFRAAFSSPDTYLFEVAKGCMPIYGVKIRFASDEGVIEAFLCLECNIVSVRRDGKTVGGEDFDGAAAEIVSLCKEVFPDDPDLRAFKPR